jgi:hypothetical protein
VSEKAGISQDQDATLCDAKGPEIRAIATFCNLLQLAETGR